MTRISQIMPAIIGLLLMCIASVDAQACGPRKVAEGDTASMANAPCPQTCAPTCLCGCQAKKRPVKMVTVSIPDTLIDDVRMLLNPGTKVVMADEYVNQHEVTVFRGDTIPMVLKSRNLGRFDRGLVSYLFIPRGTWNFGLTASYGEFSTQDLEMFSVLKDINLSANSFAIKPYITYFIKNNFSVGMRMGYTKTYAGIDRFNINIDESLGFDLKDIAYRNQAYTAAIVANQYIGIARRGRFGIFNQLDLSLTNGSSDFDRPFGDSMRYTHTEYVDTRLTFSPGVSVLMMENVSFNLSLGVFGFYLRSENQTDNGKALGRSLTSGTNFRLNIFNINFGIGILI